MAGPHVKITMHFLLERQTWSESYLDLNNSTLDSALRVRAVNLARNRLLCCGGNVQLLSIIRSVEERPSNPATTGDADEVKLSLLSTAEGPIFASTLDPALADHPAEPSDICVRFRAHGADRNHSKMIFMAGVPDDIIRTGPIGPAATASWTKYKNAWVKYMEANGWGFWARVRTGGASTPQPVLGFQQSELPLTEWGVITSTAGSLLAVNDTVQLKGFRHKGCPRCRWQGQWRISSVDTTTLPGQRIYYLLNSAGLDPAVVDVRGTIQKVEYLGIQIQDMADPVQGRRKRGGSYRLPVGRSKSRKCCGV